MVLQADRLSMRANVLTAPTTNAMRPLMATSTVIFRLQQMGRVLNEVREVAEWVAAVEEVVHEEISHFSAVPDPALPDDQE